MMVMMAKYTSKIFIVDMKVFEMVSCGSMKMVLL